MFKKTLTLLCLLLYTGFNIPYAQNNINLLLEKYNNSVNNQEKAKTLELITEYYFRSERNLDSLIKYGKYSIETYGKLKNTQEVAKAQLMVSRAYLEKADVTNSEKYLAPAADFFKDKKDIMRYARVKAVEGALLQNKHQYDASANAFNEVIDLYNTGKPVDDYTAYNAYTGLFGTYTLSQQFDRALKTSDKYLKFIQEKYPNEIGSVHMQLGNLYNFALDYERAAEELTKARSFYAKQNNKDAVASINLQLGISLSSIKKTDSAVATLKLARDHFKKVSYKMGESVALYALSAIDLEKKNYEQASLLLQEAIATSPPNNPVATYYGTQQKKIMLSMLMADSLSLVNNTEKKTQLRTAIKEFESTFKINANQTTGFVSPHELIQNHALLADAYTILSDYESAYNNYKLSTTLKDSMFGITKMRNLSSVESELNMEREKARTKLEEATKLLQLQKEMELADLRHEYDRKQAAAKTEKEREQLVHAEELKRKEIEVKYAEEQKAVALKFEQEKQIAQIEQEKKDAIATAELQSARNVRNLSALGVGLATLLLGITGWSYVQKRKDNKQIAHEKRKSDELLLNILPQEVAEELKEKGTTSAQLHDEVSILFTDFVNFTANAEKIGVEELIKELNECFTAFDQIMERHGLEKIKTIGDAYLAVSGLPASNPQHARNAVLAAKDILDFVATRRAHKATALDIRIGINSGPVVAGIVGVRKFAFDIWGDAVNTAARMEQNSQPGRINISAPTYELVKNEFNCEARGSIETKGKGAIEMYFVN